MRIKKHGESIDTTAMELSIGTGLGDAAPTSPLKHPAWAQTTEELLKASGNLSDTVHDTCLTLKEVDRAVELGATERRTSQKLLKERIEAITI